MRQLALLLLLVCSGRGAWAAPSRTWWPGWTISSSEELSESMKYSHRGQDTPLYPVPLMFDNDPATAWAYSSTNKDWDKSVFSSRYGFLLEPDRAVSVDGLRLMNGQNQSRARFLRNDRVLQVHVTMDTGKSKVVKSFDLTDRMGWHDIKLPRYKVKSLKVEFPRIRRGKGPGNDVCISELMLLDQGRKVSLGMPRAVMFYDGTEGCSGSILILHDGSTLDVVANAIGYTESWSPNGRYVCGGYEDRAGKTVVWIADAWQGKIVRRISHTDYLDYKWLGNSTLQLASGKKKPFRRIIKLAA